MNIDELAKKVGETLLARSMFLVSAESCTGGWVAQIVTSVPGSSQWFDRGFVTYTNLAKQEMLGVQATTLEEFGAVSEQVVREMAEGALKHSQASISVAVTGIAGPTGGTDKKPVGTVWFAWAGQGFDTVAKMQLFSGDRYVIRENSVQYGLQELLNFLV